MPIDPAIMNNVKMSGNIGYAKVPDGSARRFPYQQSDQGQGGGRHRGGGGGGHHHHHHSKKTKGYVTSLYLMTSLFSCIHIIMGW